MTERRSPRTAVDVYLHRQAAVVEAARDIIREADLWAQYSPRLELLRAALDALDVEDVGR